MKRTGRLIFVLTVALATMALPGLISPVVQAEGEEWQWEWQNPLPTGNDLLRVWGSNGSDVFAVGSVGTILHYDGAAWSAVSSGTSSLLYGLWGSSSSDIFAVGLNGTILHYNGTGWSRMTSGTTSRLWNVWGSSGSDVFAVGDNGIILHYNGSLWSDMTSGTSEYLYGVGGAGGSDVFAVGSNGTILHYDGTGWSDMTMPAVGDLVDVWGGSSSDVFAVGATGTIVHYNGSLWSDMTSGTTENLNAVWGSSGSDVFAVGATGTIVHYNGSLWSDMTSGTTENLNAVWGSGSDVFAVGEVGAILLNDGVDWSSMGSGPTDSLESVWGSSGSDIFAVGYDGTILNYDGAGWSAMSSGTSEHLTEVWGSSGSDVFAVGFWGAIVHYDGAAWSTMISGTTSRLWNVWGSSSSDVFAVGITGTILHYDGETWSSMISGTSEHLTGVWGSSGSDVYAVGDNGTILHYDGGTWSSMISGTTELLHDVWGSSGGDVFAVGDNGTIQHYDGANWLAMSSGVHQELFGVWGSSVSDVYAVGYNGTILHFNGGTWSRMSSGSPNWITGVWGSSGSDVFAVGYDGTILHNSATPPPPVIYVDADAVGGNEGTSWADAFTDLQDALAWAAAGTEIWVAEGTYVPTSGTGRYTSFHLKNGVSLYGGFAGTESSLADRDWVSHETILTGDIGIEGNADDNCYHVFYHPAGTNLDSTAVLDGFTITNGNATGDAWPHWDGGGVYNNGSSPTLTNCTFRGNSAGFGAGLYNYELSAPTVTNCSFVDNSAYNYGGGVFNYHSSPVMTNCTFMGNSANADGGGMNNRNDSWPVLTNSILWGNTPDEINNEPSTSAIVTYSDVQEGYAGAGNIDVDPRFLDADGPDDILGTGDDDLRLRISSPAIDAGDNPAVPGGVTTDLGGDARFADVPTVADTGVGPAPIVDMGAYEYQYASPPSIIYVDADATGANDGTSWASAFTDLQDALTWSVNGVEVWVAEGTYLSGSDGDRSATFQLVSGVDLYGGFAGGEISRDQRDWIANETILSGYNCYHIVTASGVDTFTVLDGFTITDGNADDTAPVNDGGGMLNTAGSPTIRNVIFRENYAAGYGGGMHNEAGSTPTLENVTFRYNDSDWGGGLSAMLHSDLTLTDVVFESNSANYGGGLVASDSSAPILTRVRFAGNSAIYGGGLASLYSAHPFVTDSTFENNSAHQGGAIYDVAAVTLNDSTVTGNEATQTGGGVCNAVFVVPGWMSIIGSSITGNTAIQQGGGVYNSGVMAIEDSTISGNEADPDGGGGDGYGGGVYNVGMYGLDVDNSVIEGNSATEGGGIYSEDGDAIFTNVTVSGNRADQDGGGIYDHSSSLGIKLFNVTITGNLADADDENDDGDGGGLVYYEGTVHLENTIVAGNFDSNGTTHHPDCSATGGAGIPTGEYNLIGDETGCEGDFVGIGDQVGNAASPLDPGLGRLANNGGHTVTHALLWDSLARDAGDPDGCYQSQPPDYSVDSDQRHIPRPRDGDADGTAVCDIGAFEAGPPNDAWYRAEELDLSSGSATEYEYVDQLGLSRWYKFQVAPGSRITAEMFPPDANLDIALFGDIQAAYDELQAPTSETDLVQLNAQFASDAFSPFAYSPFAYSPFAYSPFAYSPFAYSPFAYSPFAYSPFAYSPFAYSPFAYSPFAYSPFAYSPFAYSPFAYSPFAYSPFAYSPFAYSPDPAYTGAQVQTLMAISAFDGLASELIEVNTWDNHGWFYLRVSGRNGAFDVRDRFMLQVTHDEGICLGVDLIERDTPLTALNGGYHTLFLTDWDRFGGADPDELSALQVALAGFVAQYGGLVMDVGDDDYVQLANAVADAAPQCPYAKNQVAWLIKDIVTAHRDAGNPLEYVVLMGGDSVIPFFRYPDRAEIGSEKDYKPPVLEGTPSYASLTLGYVLSQDAYGSHFDLALNNTTLPVPDLAVGRLVETPAEIMNMLDTYALHGGAIAPESALVSGYDFLEDAANAIAAELEAGLGVAPDTLITPEEISPQDREGEPPLDAPWPAEMLRDLLESSRHDLVFLAGHYTAQGALAADYETHLWASDVVASTADLENALVFSAGCHSGYNVVDEHDVPYVTIEPDWAQAFAQAGATYIGGTGYQYGDTDFLEYSERLYLEFTRELRCGAQPRSVGQALVDAKQAYLAGTAQMRGIHEKALLEATLFGLPMLSVDGLSDAGCPMDPSSIVGATQSYASDPDTPGEVLQLKYADVTVTSSLVQHTVPLRNVVEDPEPPYIDATYFSGTSGVVTSPAEPVLPLEQRNVQVDGYVLRGAGFRGGRFADLPGYIPLTGAATTETRAAHTPFQSDVLYPLQPWSVNYFDLLAEPAGGITWLNVTPAQFVSDADADIWTGTWRRFDDMEFRLYYSNHTAVLDAGAVPSLAAPPAILRVVATSGTDEVQFQVAVAGDLAAGIQEVWVTYTGIPCNSGACWQSLDLAQSADDSTLWEGTLPLNGEPPGDIRYVVQAVNGVGLVSLVTNEGEYFAVDVDPADPSAGGAPASPAEFTFIEFQSPPSSGAYSTEAEFSAVLRTVGGVPLEGQRLTFSLGAQQRSAITNIDGIAQVSFPLHGVPGEYTVSAIFAGGADYAMSCTPDPLTFTILKQGTQLIVLQDPRTAQYSDDAHITVELTDADGDALGEMALLFVVSGGDQSYVVSEITDLTGQASPSRVPLPAGTYSVDAYFGQAVEVNGQAVDLTDPNYSGSWAGAELEVTHEDAIVTYSGDTAVPEGSNTLSLAAVVAQHDDGSSGDITRASVRYDVWSEDGQWSGYTEDTVAGDGTSQTSIAIPGPGVYLIRPVVFGDYFASNPSVPIGSLSIDPALLQLNNETTASAVLGDPEGVGIVSATWDWGDGTPATTCTADPGSACELTEPSGLTPGQTTAAHNYTEPGVYTMRLTVTDGDGYTAEAIYEFVVVYSLEGGSGFVTGGGWIWSEAGWCQLDEACAEATGKANFGFVSRYKQGANSPTGTSEFSFSAGGLNLHSDRYQWLVVNQAGTNAQFKGSGTVNGESCPSGDLYRFMIWAEDGEPDDDDTFRIKIWWQDGESEVVVYDNGFSQTIGGGSIVIHQED